MASPAGAVLDEIKHGEPVDDDEVVAARLANPLNDRDWESHPVLIASSPLVVPT